MQVEMLEKGPNGGGWRDNLGLIKGWWMWDRGRMRKVFLGVPVRPER